MNSDSGRANGLSDQVSLNRSGFTAGTGRTRVLAGPAALASSVVGLHTGGGRLGRYAGRARREGRKVL
jgi:hypothetical protein